MRTYADSGASDNCFINKFDFEDYELCEGQGADKTSKFKIYGCGKVTKVFETNGKHTKLTFNSALHTPNLSANLISIGCFDDAGFTIIFSGKTVRFINPDGINILTGKRSQGMYLLETVEPHITMIAKSIDKPTMLNIWHRRFGHAGISGLRELARKNLVDGLEIIKGEPLPGSCEDCIYGKHTTCPYNVDVEAEHEVLRRVHVDIWGKARIKSIRGAFYLMLFTDGGSSYRKDYYLLDKSGNTLIKCIKVYHVKSKRQTGEKLKCF